MEERRKTKRRHLLYFGRVYDQNVQKLLGYLVDITGSGFMLLSEAQYPIGLTQRLKLEVTEDIGQGPYIELTAKSIWCEPDIDPTRFDTGFEIEDIKSSDKELISVIIEKYGFRDN